MKNNISKKELTNYLKYLKEMLDLLNFDLAQNIIFFDFDSYISYINRQCSIGRRRKNIGDILDLIEPYIPFEFDDRALDFLISNIIDNYDPVTFQNILIKRAKVDFINKIKYARTKDDLDTIMDKCRNIHEYREANGILYV